MRRRVEREWLGGKGGMGKGKGKVRRERGEKKEEDRWRVAIGRSGETIAGTGLVNPFIPSS